MASNLAAIQAAYMAALRAISGIGAVEDWPNDKDAWLQQLAAPGESSRLPALHLSCKSTLTPYSTDGATREEDQWEVTGVFAYSGTNFAKYVTLRDAIHTAVMTDPTVLSLIEVPVEEESSLGPQEEMYQQFSVKWKTYHSYTF